MSFLPGSRAARAALVVGLPLAVAIFVVSCKGPPAAEEGPEPASLPVFRLGQPQVSERTVEDLTRRLFGLEAKAERQDQSWRAQSGDVHVDVCRVSGGVWAADRARMWKADARPVLPAESQALELAEKAVSAPGLLPALASGLMWGLPRLGMTRAAIETQTATGQLSREDHLLDRSVTWPVQVDVSAYTPSGGTAALPVVGGGGEFNLVLGDQGRVIGWSGTWRPVEGVREMSPVIPREECDRRFLEQVRGLKLRSFDSYLAYYAAPFGQSQTDLYPVRVYRATALVDGEDVPLREMLLPATAFGPEPNWQPFPHNRSGADRPQRRATMPEGEDERGDKDRPARKYALGAGPPPFEPVASWMECGTSFIGTSGGLSGSFANANGFVNTLSDAGWTVNFNWGDLAAWESDWNRNDDDWVDTADFVFYAGHANLNGWVLADPDDQFLHRNEVAPHSPRDLWGSQDLEWVVIAACGPLQDDSLADGGGNAFIRWRHAFDGLHQLLGYGAITFDNEQEGKRLAALCLDGETVIDAWFRAAREIQPGLNGAKPPDGPIIFAGVVFAVDSAADPGDDHILGEGSVSSDPVNPHTLVAMWTTT